MARSDGVHGFEYFMVPLGSDSPSSLSRSSKMFAGTVNSSSLHPFSSPAGTDAPVGRHVHNNRAACMTAPRRTMYYVPSPRHPLVDPGGGCSPFGPREMAKVSTAGILSLPFMAVEILRTPPKILFPFLNDARYILSIRMDGIQGH